MKEAISFCEQGLELSPDNEEFRKLVRLASGKLAEREKHEAEVSDSLNGAKVFSYICKCCGDYGTHVQHGYVSKCLIQLFFGIFSIF